MDNNWDLELRNAQLKVDEVKQTLEELNEEDAARLIRVKPIISILVTGCLFLEANIDVIRRQLVVKP